MSSKKILTAAEIRMELARRKRTRRWLSRAAGINYDYLVQILNDYRKAPAVRERITRFLRENVA